MEDSFFEKKYYRPGCQHKEYHFFGKITCEFLQFIAKKNISQEKSPRFFSSQLSHIDHLTHIPLRKKSVKNSRLLKCALIILTFFELEIAGIAIA